MSQPYIGEIRIFAGNFEPQGWAFCDGRLLAIAEFDVLFNLIGTTYGGDGQQTFALPDLRSRVPIHMGSAGGNTYQLGELGGTESVTLTATQLPVHGHSLGAATGVGHVAQPPGMVVAADRDYRAFSTSATLVPMAATAVSSVGGNQPHDNMPPFLAVNFIISLFGIFPSQT